jgi:hypothetical protein
VSQRQSGGEGSSNFQAGGDLVIRQGLSADEVRDIALDVFSRNFLELRGLAEDVALARAEKITNDFLGKLADSNPGAMANAADPDMQRSLFNAQREYACSGDDDLELALVDLLVDRAGESQPGMRRIVLNEAITAAPKLPIGQRRALAFAFLVRHASFIGALSLEALHEEYFRSAMAPLAEELPRNQAAFQHIEYVGAGTVSMGSVSFAAAMARKQRPWFTRGFSRDEVPLEVADLMNDAEIAIPCLRDPDRLQLRVANEETLAELLATRGRTGAEPQLLALFNAGAMSDEEVRREIEERTPELRDGIDAWETTSLKQLNLTTVGIAIGHGYWRRVTGIDAPLSIFLRE